jgi:hypothetical protein
LFISLELCGVALIKKGVPKKDEGLFGTPLFTIFFA